MYTFVSLLELTRLAIDPERDVGSGGAVGRYLAEQLTLERGGVRCETLLEPAAEAAPKGMVHFRWRLRCPAQGALRIESRILLAEARPISTSRASRVRRARSSAC
jgi:hypothetical protein